MIVMMAPIEKVSHVISVGSFKKKSETKESMIVTNVPTIVVMWFRSFFVIMMYLIFLDLEKAAPNDLRFDVAG